MKFRNNWILKINFEGFNDFSIFRIYFTRNRLLINILFFSIIYYDSGGI